MLQRNDYGPDYHLNNGLNGHWSVWKGIMLPTTARNINVQQHKRRGKAVGGGAVGAVGGVAKEKQLEGYRLNRNILKNIIPDTGGIYELRLWTTTAQRVVYLGKTKSLQDRILLYCYDGSHKRDKFDQFLGHKWEIHVRYYCTTSFSFWEGAILGKFEYEWNQRIPRNSQSRDVTGRYDSSPISPTAFDEDLLDEHRRQELLAEDIEIPGPHVPACKLFLRNTVTYEHPLFDDWGGKWSKWITIISPINVYLRTRNGNGSRLSRENLKVFLDPYDKGIYELSRCTPSSNPNLALPSAFVFYVGAANANTGEALYDRINQICVNGMHPALARDIKRECWVLMI